MPIFMSGWIGWGTLLSGLVPFFCFPGWNSSFKIEILEFNYVSVNTGGAFGRQVKQSNWCFTDSH